MHARCTSLAQGSAGTHTSPHNNNEYTFSQMTRTISRPIYKVTIRTYNACSDWLKTMFLSENKNMEFVADKFPQDYFS